MKLLTTILSCKPFCYRGCCHWLNCGSFETKPEADEFFNLQNIKSWSENISSNNKGIPIYVLFKIKNREFIRKYIKPPEDDLQNKVLPT